MSAIHNVLAAVGGVSFLSMLVVFIGGVFKTRNQTWTMVCIVTAGIMFVPGIMM